MYRFADIFIVVQQFFLKQFQQLFFIEFLKQFEQFIFIEFLKQFVIEQLQQLIFIEFLKQFIFIEFFKFEQRVPPA